MHDRIADNRSRPYHSMEIRRWKRQRRYILWKISNRCIRIIQILPKKKDGQNSINQSRSTANDDVQAQEVQGPK